MSTTETTTQPTDTTDGHELADVITDADGQPDWQASISRWKAVSRRFEDDAKRSAAESAEIRAELERHAADTLSDYELEQIRATAAAEVAAEFRDRLTDAEFRAAAAGRRIDLEHLLPVIDRTKFCNDAGTPDRTLIVAFLDRIAPVAPTAPIVPTVQRIPLAELHTLKL